MHIDRLETPALILDEEIFLSNLDAMDRRPAAARMKLRPHYKSHKCPAIARIQLERGAKGITCAKLGEAEDLADAGVSDILIANQIVQPEKLARLAALSKRCRLTVCADCAQNVRDLEKWAAAMDSTLFCLVELEVGMERCGVRSFEEAGALAALIQSSPHLVFEGIQAYAGHLSHEKDAALRESAGAEIEKTLRALKQYLEERGLPVKEISGGSTGDAFLHPVDTVYTELQAGSYVFMDASYGRLGLDAFRPALSVLSTVVSTRPDLIVTDAGVKSLGMDQGPPLFVGFPGDAEVRMSEEHGAIRAPGHAYAPGAKIRYIPGHCCTTANCFDKLYLIRGDFVADVWPIVSRGKAQ